jgi:hypothetical protein
MILPSVEEAKENRTPQLKKMVRLEILVNC